MAKDAKGHGSEKRGGSALARAMTDAQAAHELGQGHPKSVPVPPHGTYTTNQPRAAFVTEPGSLKATWNFWVHNRMSDGTRWDRPSGRPGVLGSRRNKWASIPVKKGYS